MLKNGCLPTNLENIYSQMKTTNRYVHALEEADERAADVLGDLVQGLENRATDDKRKVK